MQSGANPMLQRDPLLQSGGNPLMQSGGHAPLQRDGLMQSGGNPPLLQSRPSLPALPDPARPVGQHPNARQNWEPSTYRTRQPPRGEDPQSSSWNVPRILIVTAILIAIAVAILIAVT
jgi:hypothetical protein